MRLCDGCRWKQAADTVLRALASGRFPAWLHGIGSSGSLFGSTARQCGSGGRLGGEWARTSGLQKDGEARSDDRYRTGIYPAAQEAKQAFLVRRKISPSASHRYRERALNFLASNGERSYDNCIRTSTARAGRRYLPETSCGPDAVRKLRRGRQTKAFKIVPDWHSAVPPSAIKLLLPLHDEPQNRTSI